MQALPRWDGPYASTSLTIAKELSKYYRVFYVDHPFTWKDQLNDQNKTQLQFRRKFWDQGIFHYWPYEEYHNLVVISPKPLLPINFLPQGKTYNTLAKYQNAHVWKYIDLVLNLFEEKEIVYINSFDPVYSQVQSRYEIKKVIYHCVDLIEGERYIAKHGISAEKELATRADMVITTSKALKQKLSVYNDNCECVENGVDYTFFTEQGKTASVPLDIQGIPTPRVLYTGNIGLRIDYETIEEAAKKLPDYHFVLVGPENQREFKGEGLKALSNVHFLGKKPYEEIPAYVKAADICFIPFLCNELTKHIYPLKINEYLSLGKPVVCSDFAQLEDFKGVISLYHQSKPLYQVLQEVLKTHDESKALKYRTIAKSNSWKHRAEEFNNLIKQLLQYETIDPS
ncbi:glycosyltransferase [Algivirga pacifica]|uniref:Uncharacterized protein n=1 Tax=Algivirga pacifica TaxID=1162670 RepID=A0ABP9DEW6_9BACT